MNVLGLGSGQAGRQAGRQAGAHGHEGGEGGDFHVHILGVLILGSREGGYVVDFWDHFRFAFFSPHSASWYALGFCIGFSWCALSTVLCLAFLL